MKKLIFCLYLFLAASCVIAWNGWGGATQQSAAFVDSLDFTSRIQGSVTREFHSQTSFNKTGVDLFTVRPLVSYGHNKVRVQYVHLNNSHDASQTRIQGAQDSSLWYFTVLMIAYNGGVADTVTENQEGTGAWIPHIAFCGSLTLPQFRGENAWATYPSIRRTWNGKSGPSTTRSVVEGDSILFRVKVYQHAAAAALNLYWAYGMTSYSSSAAGAPVTRRYLHIQYCDTAFAWQDFVKFSTSNAKKAAIVYTAIDLGSQYQISGTRPWGNRNRAPFIQGSQVLENNIYLYRGDRVPLVSTLSAGMSASTSSFTMNRPAGWDVSYTTRASYQPSGYLAGLNDGQILLYHAINDPALIQWGFNGTINTTSDLSASTWTVTCNVDGDDTQPDTAFSSGAIVKIAWFPWMKWDGTEDFFHEGFYGSENSQVVLSVAAPFLIGYKHGFISNRQVTGIDSLVAGAANDRSSHSTGYRCWPVGDATTPPLVINEGFEFWYMKQNFSDWGDGWTWRGQFMTAFYTFN